MGGERHTTNFSPPCNLSAPQINATHAVSCSPRAHPRARSFKGPCVVGGWGKRVKTDGAACVHRAERCGGLP